MTTPATSASAPATKQSFAQKAQQAFGRLKQKLPTKSSFHKNKATGDKDALAPAAPAASPATGSRPASPLHSALQAPGTSDAKPADAPSVEFARNPTLS